MQSTQFQLIINHLTKDQTPRVWSLLVSVFGELAQEPRSQISGSLLRHITEQIGIKPEAMRVAIHRLRKDGWIDSEKLGRTSTYFLTKWGRAQSASASPRIYASGQAADKAWFVMSNPGQPANLSDPVGVWITSNVLVTSVVPNSEQVFVAPIKNDTALPDWMTSKICDQTLVKIAQQFASALDDVSPLLDGPSGLSPLEIAIIRILLVHSWRRIVLKAPVLPDAIFPNGWRGPQCRAQVTEFLNQYPRQSLDTLETLVATAPS